MRDVGCGPGAERLQEPGSPSRTWSPLPSAKMGHRLVGVGGFGCPEKGEAAERLGSPSHTGRTTATAQSPLLPWVTRPCSLHFIHCVSGGNDKFIGRNKTVS